MLYTLFAMLYLLFDFFTIIHIKIFFRKSPFHLSAQCNPQSLQINDILLYKDIKL